MRCCHTSRSHPSLTSMHLSGGLWGWVCSFCPLFHAQHMHTRHLVHGTSTTCVTPLAPVSLYDLPYGERTLLGHAGRTFPPQTFSLVMFLDVGKPILLILNWLNMPYCLKIDVFVYCHCLFMHSIMFKIVYSSLWFSVTQLTHLQ